MKKYEALELEIISVSADVVLTSPPDDGPVVNE